MAIQQERGSKGEAIAADYLKTRGFELLEQNYRSGKSEIDLIAKESEVLVFVEVKARTSSLYGNPEDFVDEAKAAKIIEGAENYIDKINWKGAIRFDIISILLRSGTPQVAHFKDAFY